MAIPLFHDDFSRGPIGDPVENNWSEISGSPNWLINSSKILQCTNADFSAVPNLLLRPSGGTPVEDPNDQLNAAVAEKGGGPIQVVLRCDGTRNNLYYAQFTPNTGFLYLVKRVAGAVTVVAGPLIITFDNTKNYLVVARVKGTSLAADVRDTASPDNIIGSTLSATVSNLSSGRMGVTVQDSTCGITDVRTYDFSDGVVPSFSSNPLASQVYANAPTAAGVPLAWAPPTGGSGNYTAIDVYRSDNADFSSPTHLATLAGSATSYTDSTCPADDALRFFYATVTDNAPHTSVRSTGCAASRPSGTTLKRAFLGDSFMALAGSLDKTSDASEIAGPFTPIQTFQWLYQFGLMPDGIPRPVNAVNGGISGAATNEWISSNFAQTAALLASMTSAGINAADCVLHCMLGLNDLWKGNSASLYTTQYTSLVNYLLANFTGQVMLHYVPYVIPGTNGGQWQDTQFPALVGYNAALESIVASIASPRLRIGSRRLTKAFANSNQSGTAAWYFNGLKADNTPANGHPNAVGDVGLAMAWAMADYQAYVAAPTSGSRVVSGGLVV